MQKIEVDLEKEDSAENESFKPLTREEALKLSLRLKKNNPFLSVWRVLAGQCLVGCLVAAIAWFLTGRIEAGWSALYGALSVIIPAALFARGMGRRLTGGVNGQAASANPGAAMAGFFFWEAIKIALTVAMLFAAPKLIASLSWLALVAGFVVTIKVVWVFMLIRPKHRLSDEI